MAELYHGRPEPLSSSELTYWSAIYELDPWSRERADLHAALICAVMSRSWGGKGEVKDFLPKFGSSSESQTLEEMRLAAQMWGAMGSRPDGIVRG